MKHYITISMIAAAALASCTQTEDFTSQYNEKAKTMKFDVAYVGKSTRVATGDMETSDLVQKKFILWGAAYQSSTPEATTGIWITDLEPLFFKKSTTTTYWEGYKEEDCSTTAEVTYPGSNYKTYFTAIAPSDEFASPPTEGKVNYTMGGQKSETTTTPTSSDRKLTLENIPVVQEINNTSDPKKGTDYLIACQNSIEEEISLKFKHLLSKLRFAVWTDEKTANGGDAKTQIELTSLKIYLPKSTATAKYVQKSHDKVSGDWTWSGFSAPNENGQPSTEGEGANYQLFTLYDQSSEATGSKVVSYFADANTAHTNFEQIKLDKNFFIAPTENETTNDAPTVKLYIDIEYTVKRKLDNNSWSSSSTSGDDGYSAGHKVVKREKMLVPVNDSNHPADGDNNEGLSHFHQGYIETLYICLRADQKVSFSTNFIVDGWVEDPINGDKLF